MSTPTVTLQLSVNGGAPQTGGITVAHGAVVVLSLIGTGIQTVRYELYEYPDGFACPAGWSTASDGYTYYVTTNGEAAPPITASIATWGKTMARAIANNGRRSGANAIDLTDERTAFQVLSSNGIEDIAYRETTQFNPRRKWTQALKDALRVLDAGGGGGGGGVDPLTHVVYVDVAASPGGDGSIGSPYSTLTAALLANAGVTNVTYYCAPGDYTAEGVITLTDDNTSVAGLGLTPFPGTTFGAFVLTYSGGTKFYSLRNVYIGDLTEVAGDGYVFFREAVAGNMALPSAMVYSVSLTCGTVSCSSFLGLAQSNTGAISATTSADVYDCAIGDVTAPSSVVERCNGAFSVTASSSARVVGCEVSSISSPSITIRDCRKEGSITLTDPGSTGSVYAWGSKVSFASQATTVAAEFYDCELSLTGTLPTDVEALVIDESTRTRSWAKTIRPSQVTVTQNNWAPGGDTVAWLAAERVYIDSDADNRQITGLVANPYEKAFPLCKEFVINGSTSFDFPHADAGSSAGNKFYCQGAAALTVSPGNTLKALYDATLAAWRATSSATQVTTALTGASNTLALVDASSKWVTVSHPSATQLTVPANATVAFPIGTIITVQQIGAGLLEIVQAVGVTVNPPPGGILFAAGQYAVLFLRKDATNTWTLFGQTGLA